MWCDEEERLDRDVRVAEVDVTKNPGNTKGLCQEKTIPKIRVD